MKKQGYVRTFSQYVGFGAFAFMFMGFMIPVGKLIVVESLAVVQVAFFSILQIDIVPVTY
jgi:hypothetical protein